MKGQKLMADNALFWIIISLIFIASFYFTITKILNVKRDKKYHELINNISVNVPNGTLSEINKQSIKMFNITVSNLIRAIQLFQNYEICESEKIIQYENEINRLENNISKYLTYINEKTLSPSNNLKKTKLHLTIGNLEELGNYAVKLQKIAVNINKSGFSLSQNDKGMLYIILLAVKELLQTTNDAYKTNNLLFLEKISPLKETVIQLTRKIKIINIKELKNNDISSGICSFISCILDDIEGIADICEIIFNTIIQLTDNQKIQKYYKDNIEKQRSNFAINFANYRSKYSLSIYTDKQ